jgi:hypothetical protein
MIPLPTQVLTTRIGMEANPVTEANKSSSSVQNLARYYEPDPDDRIRIAIKYKNTWRLIFWLQVKRDGSIYAGPRYEEIKYLAKGVKEVKGPKGEVDFKYNDGKIITDPDILKGAKMSFHASGVIHAAGERIHGESLRELTNPKQLCLVLFSHPSKYAVIPMPQKVKKRDVFIDYPIDEGRPLQAYLIVSPLSNSQLSNEIPVGVETDAVYQAPLIFGFPKMGKDMSAIAVELILYHSAMGQWPPYTGIFFFGK